MTSSSTGTHVPVLNLGYLGVIAPDPKAFIPFGSEILGAEMLSDGDDVHLKIDDRAWRIAVHPGERGGIGYLGFEVQGPGALRRAEETLSVHGVPFERVEGAAAAAERRVDTLLRLQDPAGVTVELFYGQHRDYTFRSPAGVSRFVTGDQGLGHAVLMVGDLDKTLDFYTEVMGFVISDIAVQGSARTVFLRCGPREHTLALIGIDPAKAPRLHHFMLETGELDDVGIAYDRVLRSDVQLTLTLGRHTNDSMVSFYCRTPAGFQVEYGWAGKQMVPTDAATTMVKGDVWGHQIVRTGQTVNDLLRK